MQKTSGIETAIEAAGGIKALAGKLNKTYETVRLWKMNSVVPSRSCNAVHKLTKVPLHELNPEIYPPPD